MSDREKVIKGLKCCTSFDSVDQTCMACPYENDCVEKQRNTQLLQDTLAMLKEQEPVKAFYLPCAKISTYEEIVFTHICGNCNGYILKSWKACPICGKAISWEGAIIQDKRQL